MFNMTILKLFAGVQHLDLCQTKTVHLKLSSIHRHFYTFYRVCVFLRLLFAFSLSILTTFNTILRLVISE